MRRLVQPLNRSATCTRGVAALEFAIVAPVLLLLLMGLFDLGHVVYVKSQLTGLIQKAARDSTLQDQSTLAGQTALDNELISQIKLLAPGAKVVPTRRFYRNYNEAAARVPEAWGDTDKDKRCDNNESYTDLNGNGVWDADGGDGGSTSSTPGGGAQDRTIYTVNVSYARLFPFWKMVGMSSQAELSSTTLLANQPYSEQSSYSPNPATLHCV
jgi:Flp pilus assembly protein TadG